MKSDETMIIAERSYFVDDELVLNVKLFLPHRGSTGDYSCRYELSGRINKSIAVAGIDAIDAIDSAFWMIGTELNGLSESLFGGRLRWEAAEADRPIGLPSIKDDKVPFRDY